MRCGISAEISPTHGHRSRWHHESAHNSFSAVITCVVARILFALEGLLFMHNDSSFIFCVFHGTPTGPRRAAEAGGGLRRRLGRLDSVQRPWREAEGRGAAKDGLLRGFIPAEKTPADKINPRSLSSLSLFTWAVSHGRGKVLSKRHTPSSAALFSSNIVPRPVADCCSITELRRRSLLEWIDLQQTHWIPTGRCGG